MRRAWRPAAMLWLCFPVLAAAAAAAESGNQLPRQPIRAKDGDAIGLLSRPSAPTEPSVTQKGPAVLVVHDLMGVDGRAEVYVMQLLGAGFIALEIELAPLSLDGLGGPMPNEAAAEALVMRALAALAAEAGTSRLGVLGFGAGARAVALAPVPKIGQVGAAARVLLYPGCASLRATITAARPAAALPSSPVLLLHGDDDPANPTSACSALAATLQETAPVRRIAYGGASYAWDLPAVGGRERTRLPAPDGQGLVTAWHWPALAELSAAHVAAFLCRAIDGCR